MTTGIWKKNFSIADLNKRNENTLASHLNMLVEQVGQNFLVVSMPVDEKTHQPMGLLHGGASAALAETAGSIASNMTVDENHYCVGMEINANHIRATTKGKVFATATPRHLGRTTQVWDIELKNSEDQLVAISRLTMAVREK